jgi:hypothetical protein
LAALQAPFEPPRDIACCQRGGHFVGRERKAQFVAHAEVSHDLGRDVGILRQPVLDLDATRNIELIVDIGRQFKGVDCSASFASFDQFQ